MPYTDHRGRLQTVAKDFYSVISEGLVGHYPFRIIGHNPDVDDSWEDLIPWGGTYIFPSSGIQMQISSTSADDDEGGTGVNSVIVNYLDNDYYEKEETITLNGTGVINTVATDILRV